MTISCATWPPADSPNSVITIEGSSTVYPIALDIARQYEKQHPGTQIDIRLSSTGAGFRQFSSGAIDIANASRPIKQRELQQCETNGVRFIELPVAYDAIAVVVSRDNTWARSISTSELARIWAPDSEGTVTRWNQVRPDWPDKPLRLAGPDKDSGTFDYFTKAITGTAGASRHDYLASEDDGVVVETVANDQCALGYVGLSYYISHGDCLRALAVDDEDESNGSGPRKPSAISVLDKTYQPLSRPMFIYVSHEAAARPRVRRFVQYYLGNARKAAGDDRAIPLSPQASQATVHRFQQRIYGTAFGGTGSIVGLSMDDLLEMSIEDLTELSVD